MADFIMEEKLLNKWALTHTDREIDSWISSFPLRVRPQNLPDEEYSLIIQFRLFNAKPEFVWLRNKAYSFLKPKRIAHVAGCEEEAIRLANRWGEDADDAAEAAILHDITKKLSLEEQLSLCQNYGIINEMPEMNEPQLYHSLTGAYFSRDMFGVSDRIFNAIRWHTTGCVGMSLLDEIIYLADFIEPNRSFEGLSLVREYAYTDLSKAMIEAFSLSLADIHRRGIDPNKSTIQTIEWLRSMIH